MPVIAKHVHPVVTAKPVKLSYLYLYRMYKFSRMKEKLDKLPEEIGGAVLALAEAAVYMATAPKSNSLYSGYSKVQYEINHGSNDPVPLHLRNAVTNLMKDLGYGKGYKYTPLEGKSELGYLPEEIKDEKFI